MPENLTETKMKSKIRVYNENELKETQFLSLCYMFSHLKGAVSSLPQFLSTESLLKMMKNFISKAYFVLKIFKFLS